MQALRFGLDQGRSYATFASGRAAVRGEANGPAMKWRAALDEA